jgi:hypothetical protein
MKVPQGEHGVFTLDESATRRRSRVSRAFPLYAPKRSLVAHRDMSPKGPFADVVAGVTVARLVQGACGRLIGTCHNLMVGALSG